MFKDSGVVSSREYGSCYFFVPMICEYLHFTPLTVWTGNLQDNGYFSAVDNEAHGPVDCNYHGTVTDEGTCDCFREDGVS